MTTKTPDENIGNMVTSFGLMLTMESEHYIVNGEKQEKLESVKIMLGELEKFKSYFSKSALNIHDSLMMSKDNDKPLDFMRNVLVLSLGYETKNPKHLYKH